jgi:phage host-nuclease inhibitor protein Gam
MGTVAAVVLAMLVVAPLADAEEQTRETYKAQVEPLCQVNRTANERIMHGAQRRINRDEFTAVGKQFVRVSESFGGLVKQLAGVPAPPADSHRVERWFEQMRLLKTRLRTVGKYYKEGEDIKAAHESVLAERAGITANNTSIVFHFHYCRFGRFER